MSRAAKVRRERSKDVLFGARAQRDIEVFIDKLEGWLVAQPEWPTIMGLADRSARRSAARLMAATIMTIPRRRYEEGMPNRKLRRKFISELEKAERQQERYWDALFGAAEGPGPGDSEGLPDEGGVHQVGSGDGRPDEGGGSEGAGQVDG